MSCTKIYDSSIQYTEHAGVVTMVKLQLKNLGFIVSFCIACFQVQGLDISKVSSSFTHKVFKYFYCIKRLSKTIRSITHLEKSYQKKAAYDLLQREAEFSHQDIVYMIQHIGLHQSLQTIHDMWKTMLSFRKLHDRYFFDEFTKGLLIIYKSFFSHVHSSYNHPKAVDRILALIDEAMIVDALIRLEYLDFLTQQVDEIRYSNKDILTTSCVYKPSIKISFVDAIARRYYLIERLYESIMHLKHIQRHCINYEILASMLPLFSHERIICCIQDICSTHSLDHLFFLWDELCDYKYIDDQEFAHDIAILTFIITKHICMILGQEQDKVPDIFYTAYQYIESMPLEQLLQAIDTLSTELVLIIERYELNEPISWKQWFSKYWWAPPLIITTVGIKLALILKILYKQSNFKSILRY